MKTLIFGNGEIGVHTTNSSRPSILLSSLDRPHDIGTHYKEEQSRSEVLLIFKNKEGLDILMIALQRCKENLIELPDELRMGA